MLVPVLGAHSYAGTSGVALAMADAAAALGLRVLLVDCADPVRTGLAGVCGTEGASTPVPHTAVAVRVSQRMAERGGVQVRRLVAAGPLAAAQIPPPKAWAAVAPTGFDLTVVDLGWDVWPLLTSPAELGPAWWLAAVTEQNSPVLVMRPSMSSAANA
jgi:hypothetical protein